MIWMSDLRSSNWNLWSQSRFGKPVMPRLAFILRESGDRYKVQSYVWSYDFNTQEVWISYQPTLEEAKAAAEAVVIEQRLLMETK